MAYDSFPVVCRNNILDIGGSILSDDIAQRLRRALTGIYKPGEKPTLPDELLYDGLGLFIWNEIIMIPEFYQTHDEIALFDTNGADIVSRIPENVTMIDLGAGDTRKVQHLLAAFEAAKKPATYLALDISKASLEQNVSYLVSKHSGPDASVQCGGLWGTFGDGMAHVETIQSPRLFLSLGSVLCNDPWFEALSHLRSWARLMQPEDYLLIGMDGHLAPQDGQKIWDAYHSCDDLYKQFFLNGFRFSNELLEEEWFREEDWDLLAEMEEHPTTRHRFFFRSKRAVAIKSLNLTFEKGQELDWFDSHKYGEETVRLMASKAGLVVDKVWKAPGSEFRQYLVRTRQGKDDSSDGDSAVAGLD